MDKVVYVTVRMVVDKDANVFDVVEECDYSFTYEDKILSAEITDMDYDPDNMP